MGAVFCLFVCLFVKSMCNKLLEQGFNVSGTVPVLLTEHHAVKAYWGVEVIAPLIL
jgi:hypothetical protein